MEFKDYTFKPESDKFLNLTDKNYSNTKKINFEKLATEPNSLNVNDMMKKNEMYNNNERNASLNYNLNLEPNENNINILNQRELNQVKMDKKDKYKKLEDNNYRKGRFSSNNHYSLYERDINYESKNWDNFDKNNNFSYNSIYSDKNINHGGNFHNKSSDNIILNDNFGMKENENMMENYSNRIIKPHHKLTHDLNNYKKMSNNRSHSKVLSTNQFTEKKDIDIPEISRKANKVIDEFKKTLFEAEKIENELDKSKFSIQQNYDIFNNNNKYFDSINKPNPYYNEEVLITDDNIYNEEYDDKFKYEVEDLRKQNKILKKSIKSYKDRIKMLTHELKTYKKSNIYKETFTQYDKNLNEFIQDLKDSLEQTSKYNEELEDKINNMKNEKQIILQKNEDLVSNLELAKKEFSKIAKESSKLKVKLENNVKLINEKDNTIKEKEKEINNLNDTITELNNKINYLNQIQESNKIAQKDNSDLINELKSTIDNLNNINIDNNKDILELKNSINDLNNNLEIKDNEINKMKERINKDENLLKQNESKLDEYNKLIIELKNKNENYQNELRNNGIQSEKYKNEIKSLNILLSDRETTISELKNSIKFLTKTFNKNMNIINDNINNAMNNEKNENLDLNKELKELVEKMQKEVIELNKMNNQKEKEKTNLENEINEYNEQYEKIKYDYQLLYQKFNEQNKIIEMLKKEFLKRKNDNEIQKLTKTNFELLAKYKKAENENLIKMQQLEQMKKKYDLINHQFIELSKNICNPKDKIFNENNQRIESQASEEQLYQYSEDNNSENNNYKPKNDEEQNDMDENKYKENNLYYNYNDSDINLKNSKIVNESQLSGNQNEVKNDLMEELRNIYTKKNNIKKNKNDKAPLNNKEIIEIPLENLKKKGASNSFNDQTSTNHNTHGIYPTKVSDLANMDNNSENKNQMSQENQTLEDESLNKLDEKNQIDKIYTFQGNNLISFDISEKKFMIINPKDNTQGIFYNYISKLTNPPLFLNTSRGLFFIIEDYIFHYNPQENNIYILNKLISSHNEGGFIYIYDEIYSLSGRDCLLCEKYSIENKANVRLPKVNYERINSGVYNVNDEYLYIFFGEKCDNSVERLDLSIDYESMQDYINNWEFIQIESIIDNIEKINLEKFILFLDDYNNIIIIGGCDKDGNSNQNIYGLNLTTNEISIIGKIDTCALYFGQNIQFDESNFAIYDSKNGLHFFNKELDYHEIFNYNL